MSRILVTGAAGFVGRALCPALATAGHEVVAAVRDPGAANCPRGVTVKEVPDVGPDTHWGDALAGADAVIHLAARVHVMRDRAADPLARCRRVNAAGSRRLAEAAAANRVRRLVFLSTVKVNGEATPGAPFRESDPPAPRDPYARSKLEAEDALSEVAARTGLEVVILRPPLVYGPHAKGNVLSLLELCRRAPPLPLGGIGNRRSLIYLGNLCDAVVRCLAHDGAAGETFLVRDGEDLSTADLIRRLAAALGRPSRLFAVPDGVLRLTGTVTGKSDMIARLLDSLCVDDGKIRRQLGWSPPYTVEQGLRETARWFLSTADD